MNDTSTLGWALLMVTFLLVVLGCFLYIVSLVGLAQFAWVLASGTAGAGIVLVIEGRKM